MEPRLHTAADGIQTRVSRRYALATLSASAAAFASGSWAASDGRGHAVNPGARPLPVTINTLGFLDDPNVDIDAPFAAASIEAALASSLTAMNLSMGWVDGAGEPFERSVRDVAGWDALVRSRQHQLIKVWKSTDIELARATGKLGLMFVFQNAAMLGEDVGRVDVFADLGVRAIGLTYNRANQLGDGAAAPLNRGLTAFGHSAIERMNARRVIVDLSHSGEKTCLEAANLSKLPVSISHTGCRALANFPRNKSDAELRRVAANGGFVGIYFMYFLRATGLPNVADVLAHLDHAIDVCGEDHVGVGTDGSLIAVVDLESYKEKFAAQMRRRSASGVAAPGEREQTLPFVVELQGPQQFRELARHLEAHGYSSARIEKILGGNYLRFLRDVWGE